MPCRLVALFLLVFASQELHAIESEPWFNPQWLNLYQYEQSITGNYRSDIKNQSFFFSPNGRQSPKQEYLAAIEEFAKSKKIWGVQKLPVACIFPARRQILEKLSGQSFPATACPDLDEWIANIGAKQVSLVFAGAYPGNPASVLGHTFLRFYGSDDRQLGQDLLSYSVGFLANPEPGDSKALYILRGLTGGYPGYYDIEAHYIKVGIYNNSESRDLWEWPLNLNEAEVTLLIKYIWELTFNAQFRYYFIDENCSYRVLKAINVIRPQAEFENNMGLIVLPSETVQLASEQKVLSGEVLYRPSIERKISMNLGRLNSKEIGQFNEARKKKEAIKKIKNPVVLDALIDYWIHARLKERTELDQAERDLMEETHRHRASLKTKSPESFTNEQIKKFYQLGSILEGHRSSYFSLTGDLENAYELSLSRGVQPAWMSSKGYDNIDEIDFLGVKYQHNPTRSFQAKDQDRWEFLVIRAKSLGAANGVRPKYSWGFDASLRNECVICDNYDSQTQLKLSGRWGGALIWKSFSLYLLPELQLLAWQEKGSQAVTPVGGVLGAIFEKGRVKFLAEYRQLWWKKIRHGQLNWNLSYLVNQNLSARWELVQNWRDSNQGEATSLVGAALFF